jgi:hypothetical protein
MTDVILYGILSLAALYTIYRVDPEHSEGKYTGMWSFYLSILFSQKREANASCLMQALSHSLKVGVNKQETVRQ